MNDDPRGRLVGRTHHFPVRVYFADTDAGGMVYHATYLDFAERARTELMRIVGFDHVELRKREGILIGVRAVELDYLRPALLDDLLEIRTSLEELGGASMRLRQDVWRGEVEIARISVRLAFIGSDGKPARIPREMQSAIQEIVTAEAI
jgi:acyl-CoA thioester hydrolase